MKVSRIAAVLLLASVCYAQTEMQVQVGVQGQRPGGAPEAAAKPTPEQLKRGHQMLEAAEAEAGDLEGGMRAYALLQVARAYQASDKKKAVRLMDDALAATRGVDDDRIKTRLRLQEEILRQMVPLAPQRVDELLVQVEPEARGTALNALLGYYEKNNDLDRGLQMLYRIAQESEMPYGAALRFMQALPPERSGDVLQLFLTSLTSFQNHQHRGMCAGDCDFAPLVLKFWQRLPREAVLDAVHAMLKEAKERGSEGGGISMASDQGAVAFNSYYEFRLFQLLPVLRQVDESEAKKLLQEYQQVQTLLTKYPQGTDSLQGQPGAGGGEPRGSTSFMVSGDGPRRRGGPTPLEFQQVSKIAADAEKHPRDALAACAAIADPGLRAQALQAVARATWKKESSVAREALQKYLDLIPQVEVVQQVMMYATAARMYLDMDETADAKKVIEKGLTATDKAYEKDSNADDPNKALKAYWPSAEGYRSMLRLAAKISPAWGMTLAEEITDPEMKAVAHIAMANALLNVPAGATTIISATKSGVNMSTSVQREN